MMRVVVTGAAGFVGSHLCERLLDEGNTVIGIDAFVPYYPRLFKEQNLRGPQARSGFTFLEADLRMAPLAPLVEGADQVVHLAAMAGLVRSWQEFDTYMTCNVQGTQRLIEAVRSAAPQAHVVHASTSSVYGRFATGDESSPLEPVSPYGITKLAAENLVRAYSAQFALRATVLRLFSVYGPRQRPDMGYNIFIRRMLAGETIVVDGDGTDSRSNTYVLDCVDGIMRALAQPEASIGETFNIGGGQEVNVNDVLAMLEELTGTRALVEHGPARPGDQRRTVANFAKARTLLGYDPQTLVVDGLRAQLAWQRTLADSTA